MVKYYRKRGNSLTLLALQDEVIRLNQDLKTFYHFSGEKNSIPKLSIGRFSNQLDKKSSTCAFYEDLYPITQANP